MNGPTVGEVTRAVAGAFRLAHFDVGGLALFDLSRHGAARSFWAAALVLPAYVAIALLRGDGLEAGDVWPLRLAAEAVGYVVGWTAFPVLLSYLMNGLGHDDRYFAFVCAYNWSAVVQLSVYLPLAIITESRLLPDDVGDGLSLGVVMAMLVYQWFIARAALGVSRRLAAALVLVDMIIAMLIGAATSMVG